MKEFLLKLGSVITAFFAIFLIGKSQGKKDKENEIIENNEKKKKKYKDNKYSSINDVIDELSK